MKPHFAIILSLGFFAVSAHAQQEIQLEPGDVQIEGMETEVQQTPDFEAGNVKGKNVPNPRDWLEVEVEFEVDGPSEAVVPELLFRYYVGFRNEDGQAVTLTGDVKHVNVVAGETYFSVVYANPSTLGEITGDFRRFQDNNVQAVGVEVIYNGVIVGLESSSGGNNRFWQQTGTQKGLLPKTETPFALLWIDRYAQFAPTND